MTESFYLDGDIIVNNSIQELYDTDFKGAALCAAYDAGKIWKSDQLKPKQREMLGNRIDHGYIYFNSGVLLMNMDVLRDEYPFFRYVKAFEEWDYGMTAPDQDILNYVHGDQVIYFDYKKYNYFARVAHNDGMSYERIKEECAIIHYAGEKPWESENVHYDIEQLWWDYAAKTPLYHELLESFLHSSMTNTVVEDYIIGLQNDNAELKATIMQVTGKMKELFG